MDNSEGRLPRLIVPVSGITRLGDDLRDCVIHSLDADILNSFGAQKAL